MRRILDRRDVTDVDMETVTLFHVSSYVDENGEAQDFAKLVEKLALESKIAKKWNIVSRGRATDIRTICTKRLKIWSFGWQVE